MKMRGGPASVYLKIILLIVAFLIAAGTLAYTHSIVNKLKERERQTVELYAGSLEYIARSENPGVDYTFLLDIIKRIDFPLILTDAQDTPVISDEGGIRNLNIDTTLSFEERLIFVKQKIEELKSIHKPIPVYYNDSVLVNKIYYGDSELVNELRYYPYLQILIAVIFILISYTGFSYLKRTEQSNIWVGMAKETAHQLGTPISSLMGWQEILKLNYLSPDKVLDVSEEMKSDLNRLNKIANRFSKIGSKPELKDENVTEIIAKVIEYFNRRLPRTENGVTISIDTETGYYAMINHELFEWVIENLIKNALDAIENKPNGVIAFRLSGQSNYINIEVIDNGKGIDLRRRKDIFRPGYSTKRRGWGLGLSLSKRIIEEYHKGKIFVKNSIINEGTVFNISLRKSTNKSYSRR